MDRALHPSDTIATRPARRLLRTLVWAEAVFRTVRERRQLMSLDEHGLKDIGMSRADAYCEWSRPFWDVPRDR
ncbi:DUF1127 domain-containing protein [Hyphomicrobium sp. CS1GBMeth3]|uniref:DUF1127 domain-containing protein n=1 Tax=Hyphomicrobium sp. CS1GBMeth3 TaxID=1892845 RepID=UPI000930640B|nr:DUF1127 domain-containing protein [Hyphomicrobium sp. CS1GBMeth3]